MDVPKAFSLALRKFRKEKGLTHEKLAEKANLHPTAISLLERNKRQPSITTVFLLAEGLGVAPEEIVREVRKHLSKSTKLPAELTARRPGNAQNGP